MTDWITHPYDIHTYLLCHTDYLSIPPYGIGVPLLCHMVESSSRPYETTSEYICHMDELLLILPYEFMFLNYMNVILIWKYTMNYYCLWNVIHFIRMSINFSWLDLIWIAMGAPSQVKSSQVKICLLSDIHSINIHLNCTVMSRGKPKYNGHGNITTQ